MDKIDFIEDFENEIDNYNSIDHNKLSGIINLSDGINIIDKNFDVNDKNYKSDVLDIENKENCKSTEEIEELLKKIREKIIIDLKNIKNGDINIKPYKKNNMDSCEYCPYKNLCRYDDKNNNNEEDE